MNRSSLPIGLSTLKKWWSSLEGVLKCSLPFQRHDNMWSAITKSMLVWSILADSYIPPIVLLKDKSGTDSKGKDIFTYQVLDGQQRLTTLFSFIDDEWSLHGSTPEVEVDGTVYDLEGIKFSEMSAECQDAIRNYHFSVQCLENYTMTEAESLFYNINSGVSLSTIQKSKAKLGTDLIGFLNGLLQVIFSHRLSISRRSRHLPKTTCYCCCRVCCCWTTGMMVWIIRISVQPHVLGMPRASRVIILSRSVRNCAESWGILMRLLTPR